MQSFQSSATNSLKFDSQASTFTVKVDPADSDTADKGSGASNRYSVNSDELLVYSGLTASSGATIVPVAVSQATPYASYSWVIIDDSNGSDTTFANFILPNGSNATNAGTYTTSDGTYSLSDQSDGSGGEDLILNETSPEPSSALFLGLAAAPLLIHRRRRPKVVPASASY